MKTLFLFLIGACIAGSCCDGNKSEYTILPKDEIIVFKVGDTLFYSDTIGNLIPYVLTKKEISMRKYKDLNDGCGSAFYEETLDVMYKNIITHDTSLYYSHTYGKGFNIIWYSKEYDEMFSKHFDSLLLQGVVFDNVFYMNYFIDTVPGLYFNYKYGIIQYEDTLHQKWTIIQKKSL
jgi:hypothetical protein